MIVTLTGENSFAVAAAERQLAEAFIAKHGAHAIEQVDGEELTPARLPDLLQGTTLFASARLVVLKNLGSNKAMLEPLAEALKTTAPDTTVVVADPALDKRTKLYRFLKASSTFKDFSFPSDKQLISWLQAEAKRLGGELGAAEARFLVEQVGNDQWRLASELQKLAAHPIITKKVIEQLVDPNPEATAFGLLDAALAGDTTEVARLLGFLKTQEDPYKLFGLLASQAHTLAVVASAGSRSTETIAKEAGLHPFAVRKAKGVVSKLGQARVRQLVADVALCDARLKSSGADPWLLLQVCLQK